MQGILANPTTNTLPQHRFITAMNHQPLISTSLPRHIRLWVATLLVVITGIPLFVSTSRAAEPVAGDSRPNVLFIAVDDLRPALGCYGDPLAQSPHIDQLAKSSRVFQRAYVQQAVCGASRASMLTGRLPDQIRVWHNRHLFRDTLPNGVTLPQLFKNNGYHAQGLGKVFSGQEDEEDPASWTVPVTLRGKGWRNSISEDTEKRSGKGAPVEAADVADDDYPDGKLADLAIETLQRLQGQQTPFFLAVGFFKPHLPFNAPKKYWDLYDPASFDFAEPPQSLADAPELAYHTHRELGGYRGIPKDERVSAAQSRQLRHGYYACVSYVDAQVGKLLGALERLGLQENTIVVLWGDHGFALGEEARWCKGTNFELDTRVPLMIRTPKLNSPGVASESLVEATDIYPTLAELAGLTPPDDLAGRSMVPVLNDPAESIRDHALSQFPRPWKKQGQDFMGYSIRTPRHRYTRWVQWPSRQTFSEELYDYAATQGNVAEHPEYVEDRDQLRQQMDNVLSSRLARD
jgi:arylsulfatase A-like enzyme